MVKEVTIRETTRQCQLKGTLQVIFICSQLVAMITYLVVLREELNFRYILGIVTTPIGLGICYWLIKHEFLPEFRPIAWVYFILEIIGVLLSHTGSFLGWFQVLETRSASWLVMSGGLLGTISLVVGFLLIILALAFWESLMAVIETLWYPEYSVPTSHSTDALIESTSVCIHCQQGADSEILHPYPTKRQYRILHPSCFQKLIDQQIHFPYWGNTPSVTRIQVGGLEVPLSTLGVRKRLSFYRSIKLILWFLMWPYMITGTAIGDEKYSVGQLMMIFAYFGWSMLVLAFHGTRDLNLHSVHDSCCYWWINRSGKSSSVSSGNYLFPLCPGRRASFLWLEFLFKISPFLGCLVTPYLCIRASHYNFPTYQFFSWVWAGFYVPIFAWLIFLALGYCLKNLPEMVLWVARETANLACPQVTRERAVPTSATTPTSQPTSPSSREPSSQV